MALRRAGDDCFLYFVACFIVLFLTDTHLGHGADVGAGSGGGSGGGNESKSLSNTTVTLQGNTQVLRNVYGGGNQAEVLGSTTVNIQE